MGAFLVGGMLPPKLKRQIDEFEERPRDNPHIFSIREKGDRTWRGGQLLPTALLVAPDCLLC